MFLDSLKAVLGLVDLADNEKISEVNKLVAAERAIQRERARQLYQRFEAVDLGYHLAGKPFSDEEEIDLGVARTNALIWNRPFKALCITEISVPVGTPSSAVAYLRFDNKTSSMYRLRTGVIKGHFLNLYLTNTAQANLSFKFVIVHTELADYGMLGEAGSIIEEINSLKGLTQERTLAELWTLLDGQPRQATTPNNYSVDMASADTEYSQALPVGTKIVNFHLRDYATFRYAWVTGKVAGPTAPFWNVIANEMIERRGLYLSGETLYFGESVGTKVMQIEAYQ